LAAASDSARAVFSADGGQLLWWLPEASQPVVLENPFAGMQP
jgi:hypothetical protein